MRRRKPACLVDVELEGLPEPHYVSTDIKEAFVFDSKEEAEAILRTLGPGYQLLEIPDEDTKVKEQPEYCETHDDGT